MTPTVDLNFRPEEMTFPQEVAVGSLVFVIAPSVALGSHVRDVLKKLRAESGRRTPLKRAEH